MPYSRCLLCHSSKAWKFSDISYSDLKRLYADTFQIDIDKSLSTSNIPVTLSLFECDQCRLQYFPPELAGNSTLYEKLGLNDWYYGNTKWEFNHAVSYLKGAKSVLEVGCGAGHFLDFARTRMPGIRTVGLEFNPKAAEQVKTKGHEVSQLSVEDFRKDPVNRGAFDVVCSFQVLEHVADPRTFLESSLTCVKPGGLLIISVPNREGFTQYAVNDLLNMPPHHITRWSAHTFKNLAKLLGITLEELTSEPIAEYHRSWYRTTLLRHRLALMLGLKFKEVELPEKNLIFRIMNRLVAILDHSLPERSWSYSLPGHTFCAVLRSPIHLR